MKNKRQLEKKQDRSRCLDDLEKPEEIEKIIEKIKEEEKYNNENNNNYKYENKKKYYYKNKRKERKMNY